MCLLKSEPETTKTKQIPKDNIMEIITFAIALTIIILMYGTKEAYDT